MYYIQVPGADDAISTWYMMVKKLSFMRGSEVDVFAAGRDKRGWTFARGYQTVDKLFVHKK